MTRRGKGEKEKGRSDCGRKGGKGGEKTTAPGRVRQAALSAAAAAEERSPYPNLRKFFPSAAGGEYREGGRGGGRIQLDRLVEVISNLCASGKRREGRRKTYARKKGGGGTKRGGAAFKKEEEENGDCSHKRGGGERRGGDRPRKKRGIFPPLYFPPLPSLSCVASLIRTVYVHNWPLQRRALENRGRRLFHRFPKSAASSGDRATLLLLPLTQPWLAVVVVRPKDLSLRKRLQLRGREKLWEVFCAA